MPATLRPQARSQALIPGVYQTCDQWCMYCRVTDRCLAFRSSNAGDVNAVWDPADASTAERVGDGLQFMKALADAEGCVAPPEIAAVLSGNSEQQRLIFTLDDPLERLGGSYMDLATAYLTSRSDFPVDPVWRRDGPTAIEVLTWFHDLAPARVFRAILCAAEAKQGVPGRDDDALCAAKVALIGIDRSLIAVAAIAADDADPRVELMQRSLERLRVAVEARFPGARRFGRPGLDDAPGCERQGSWLRRFRAVRTLLDWRHERPAAGPASSDLRGCSRRSGDARG